MTDAIEAVQRELPEIAAEYTKLERRLEALVEQLPRAPREQDMLDDYYPRDLATELRAALEVNGMGGTREIVAALRQAAEATAETLADRFIARQRSRTELTNERSGPRRMHREAGSAGPAVTA